MSTQIEEIQAIRRPVNTLNVLMVALRYFPYMGGVETHVHEVGRRLVRNGVNVTLLTTVPFTRTNSLVGEEMVEGMRVIRVPSWPSQRDYSIAPEIYTVISKGSWDIVHCQGCHAFVPPLAMFAAKRAKIPYVVTFHTGGHSSPFRSRIRDMQWHTLRPLFAGAAKLIGVSQFEADYFRSLLSLPEQRFSVIPNGASVFELPQSLPPQPADQTLIISIGRLERYKGHHRLIAALPKVREQLPNARLLILGAGPYEEALHELARKSGVAEYVEIRAIPAQNRQLMAETLAQASLVTLMSDYEAHPIGVMEALSLGRPVLVADTSGLHELAEQGLARAVPLHSTAEEIATAIIQQINEPIVSSPISLPTWEDCGRNLQDLYMSIRLTHQGTTQEE